MNIRICHQRPSVNITHTYFSNCVRFRIVLSSVLHTIHNVLLYFEGSGNAFAMALYETRDILTSILQIIRGMATIPPHIFVKSDGGGGVNALAYHTGDPGSIPSRDDSVWSVRMSEITQNIFYLPSPMLDTGLFQMGLVGTCTLSLL